MQVSGEYRLNQEFSITEPKSVRSVLFFVASRRRLRRRCTKVSVAFAILDKDLVNAQDQGWRMHAGAKEFGDARAESWRGRAAGHNSWP